MRLFSLALFLAVALQGCAGGAIGPTSGSPVSSALRMGGDSYLMMASAVTPITKNCPKSKYAFCIAVSSSTTGPYIEWSACNGSNCPPSYDLALNNAFYKKTGVPLKPNKLGWTYAPEPGNPTYIYINEKNRPIKPSHGKVKIVGKTQACLASNPSDCSGWITYGIIFV